MTWWQRFMLTTVFSIELGRLIGMMSADLQRLLMRLTH